MLPFPIFFLLFHFFTTNEVFFHINYYLGRKHSQVGYLIFPTYGRALEQPQVNTYTIFGPDCL